MSSLMNHRPTPVPLLSFAVDQPVLQKTASKNRLPALVLLFALLLGVLSSSQASNIQVNNVVLTGQDSTAGFSLVQFDLNWQNSWRYSNNANINNWDAAWVFVKFRVGGTDYVSAPGASSNGNTITVNTTSGLRVGMPVHVSAGTGVFEPQTVVTAILNSTSFSVSTAPSTPLSGGAVVTAFRIWEHAWLGDLAQHSTGSGTAASLENGLRNPAAAFNASSNPSLGALLYRSGEGYGTFSITNAQLRWNYAQNNVGNQAVVEIRVYAIEMVYVPQGAFYVGDGSSSNLHGQLRDASLNIPFLIASEDTLTLGGSDSAQLGNNNATGMSTADDFNNSTTQGLSPAFPKGFAAFYSMKYELSQQQYVDFLNALQRLQQNNRTGTDLSPGTSSVTNRYVMSNSSSLLNRNGIRCNGSINAWAPVSFYCDLNGNGTGGEAADGQNIAANYLSWGDVAAYLDWSALRPMSELEYEKIARGQLAGLAQEYAWGQTTLTAAEAISNAGANNEGSSTTGANAVFGNQGAVQGPLRVGAFAADSSFRSGMGAGFWDAVELSGNLNERVVNIGTAAGRAFSAQLGDGQLIDTGSTTALYGQANTPGWPAATAVGQGLRGGGWQDAALRLRTSDRAEAINSVDSRSANAGGRGLRQFPCTAPSDMVSITGNSINVGLNGFFSASGSTNYWWIVPADWEIISGQGTSSIEVYATTPGLLRVAALNSCGTGPESSVAVTIN
ncbi:MAG: SUMF1/EgtB/PvdO family nonheme iron enzyme [Sphingobacteriaceae bacterium]|nr:SUMF1/EgtB/PvdO family nonheme iron enzyme [Sphingobacteriaceae bacterium]